MLRLFSPIQLCFCLILFFLPWIEVQCVPNPAAVAGNPGGGLKMDGMPTGPQPLLSQSGLQIATGGYTITNPLLTGEMGGKGRPKAGGATDKDDDGPPGAPLLFLFPVAVLAGIVIGFLPLAGMGRKLLLLACCGVALGVIGVQAGMGFPVKKSFDEDKAKSQKGGGGRPMMEEGMDLKVVWMVPLYITLFFLAGAAGTAFLGGKPPAPKSGRRRYDDDRDDDEDDRPRRRPADDDREDDRPRRRARRDD